MTTIPEVVPVTTRHEHSYPCNPPDGTFLSPGACECGKTYAQAQAEQHLGEARVAAALAGVEIITVDELTAAMRNRSYTEEHIAQLLRAIRRDREAGGLEAGS